MTRHNKIFFIGLLLFIPFWGLAQQTASIIGVGDIMMGTNYPESPPGAYLPANGGATLFADVTPFFKTADIVFGNLEGVLMDKGGTPKRCNNPSVCYLLDAPIVCNQLNQRRL